MLVVTLVAAFVLTAPEPPAPAWPLELPAPGALAWVSPIAAGEVPDHRRVTFSLPPELETGPTWKTWCAALAAAGWTTIAREDGTDSGYATFERGELRALLMLHPPSSTAGGWGTVELAKARRAPDTSTRCLPIPEAAWEWTVFAQGVDQQGERHASDIRHGRRTARLLDVDGDLVLDALVPLVDAKATRCPEDTRWQVWRVRPALKPGVTCGYPIGEIGPGTLADGAWRAVRGTGDLRDVITERETSALGREGIPELTTETWTARFDGQRYVVDAPVSRTGRCHHCATWHCNGPTAVP